MGKVRYYAILFLCFLSTVICEKDVSCGGILGNETIGMSNICLNVTGKPFCVNVVPDPEQHFVCRQCQKNCDCGLEYYCVKSTAGSERGNCKLIETDKIDTPCNNFDELDPVGRFVVEPKTPTFGVDDKLVCGIPIFDSLNKFTLYEWLGSCTQGKCKVCSSLGPIYTQELDYLSQGLDDTLFCPGRVCVGSKLQMSQYAVESSQFQIFQTVEGINGTILAFVILLTLFNFVMCICSVRASRNPKRYKKMTQQM